MGQDKRRSPEEHRGDDHGYLEALRKEGLPLPKPKVFELEEVVVAM
jgi:hypothetical protein